MVLMLGLISRSVAMNPFLSSGDISTKPDLPNLIYRRSIDVEGELSGDRLGFMRAMFWISAFLLKLNPQRINRKFPCML
jgi:hypothetical protein